MPEEIIIDGLEEHAFRRSIESMLRNGRADEAVERLKKLLPECAGEGMTLPGRLLELSPEDINLAGWDQLAAKVTEYSRPSTPITAIGIGISDPADAGLEPDADGNLRPPLATSFYSDATFPFSETDRADLLEGYSAFGCEWQGDHDQIDETLSIEGIDDLYGAIARLENDVASSADPSTDDIRAGAIGACYLGVMVWQAARRAVIEQGLPRPLAILLVNSDAYPFFDAPVMTCDEYLDDGAIQVVTHESAADPEDADAEEQEAASLVDLAGLGAHREKTKKMALVLDGAEAHNPLGMADDLVAQAAFEPNSVDISRFMPDASEFRNEPDPELEEEIEQEDIEATDTSQDDLADGPDDEYEFPVDGPDDASPVEIWHDKVTNDAEARDRFALPPAEPLRFSESADPFADAKPVDAFDRGDGSESNGSPEPDEHGYAPVEDDSFSPGDPFEPGDALEAADTPEEALSEEFDETAADGYAKADRWQPPDWATQPGDGSGATNRRDQPDDAVSGEPDQFVPIEAGQETDLPFEAAQARSYASSQPASHSIRARIRTAPIEQQTEHRTDSLVVRFIAWLRKLLLRR